MTIKFKETNTTFSDVNATQNQIRTTLRKESLTKGYRYPANLGTGGQKAFISFGIKDSVKLFNAEPEIEEEVHLYLPPTLKVKYGTSYDEVSLDLSKAAALASNIGGGTVQGISDVINRARGMDGISPAFADKFRQALQTAANALANTTGSNLNLQAGVATGLLVNPHMAVAFTGVEFRTFQFSFQLMAKNPEESESIRQIIKFFKKHMHPSIKGGAAGSGRWLLYPKNFDITMNAPIDGNIHMFEIKTSALKSVEVDYAGSGTPSFFNAGAPVDVRLDLQFQELTWLTQEDFEGDNNF